MEIVAKGIGKGEIWRYWTKGGSCQWGQLSSFQGFMGQAVTLVLLKFSKGCLVLWDSTVCEVIQGGNLGRSVYYTHAFYTYAIGNKANFKKQSWQSSSVVGCLNIIHEALDSIPSTKNWNKTEKGKYCGNSLAGGLQKPVYWSVPRIPVLVHRDWPQRTESQSWKLCWGRKSVGEGTWKGLISGARARCPSSV